MKKPGLTIKLTLVAVLLTLSSWSTAQAASITFLTSWNTSQSAAGGNDYAYITDIFDASTSSSISQFDSAMGTLQGITIDIYNVKLEFFATARFHNFTDDFATGYQSLSGMSVGLNMPDYSFTRFHPPSSETCSGELPAWYECSTTTGFISTDLSDDSESLNLADFDAYVGTGNVDINIFQTGSLFTDETGGPDGYVDGRNSLLRTSGDISITYDYEVAAVPIPAAAWLFGSALAGLFGIGKLRKRQAA